MSSMMSEAVPDYIDLPLLATPPVPAAATTGRWVLYGDTDGNLYVSVNGGAYTTIATGTISLDSAYTGGNQINLTQAKGAVILSSARTSGNILQIATTNAPATVTAQVTGIAIDMSSLGTAATPSTFDLPAITVTGAYSSVAKSATKGLVYLVSGYRNATVLRVSARNKQATAGSIVAVGWDATNYEGAAASSVLTGTTHMLTLDGVTNVDASTNNVEFLNLRCLVPQTDTLSGTGILIQRGSDPVSFAQPFLRIIDDVGNATTPLQGVAISLTPALATIQTTGLVVSVNGLLSTISGAASFSYGALAGTTRGTVRIFGPLGGPTTGAHTHLSVGDVPTSQTLGAALTGISVPLGTNITAGAQVVTAIAITMPASTSTSTSGVSIASNQKAGAWFRGSVTSATTTSGQLEAINLDQATNLTYGAQVYGIKHLIRGGNAAIGGIAYRLDMSGQDGCCWRGLDFENGVTYNASRSGTNSNGSAFIFLYDHPAATGAGVTLNMSDRVITIDHAPSASGGAALVDSTYLVDITASPGTGTNNVRVFSVTMGANNNGANTRMFYGTSAQTQGRLFDISATGTLSGSFRGVSVDMSGATAGAQTVLGHYISLPATSSGSSRAIEIQTLQSTGTLIGCFVPSNMTPSAGGLHGLYLDLQTNVLTSANSVNGVTILMPINTAGTNTGAVRILSQQRAGVLGFSGSFNGATILSGALTGVDLDMSTSVTPGAQTVVGYSVSIPASTSTSTRVFSGTSAQTDGRLFQITSTGTVGVGGLIGAYFDMTGATAGANFIQGIRVDTPASTSLSTAGMYCGYLHRAGSVFVGQAAGAVALSGTLNGLFLQLATNVTAGAQTVYGAYIAMPASSSASTTGVYVTTAQTAGTGVQVGFTGSLGATVVGYGLDLYNVTHNNQSLNGIYLTIGTTTAAAAQTTGAIVIDDWATKQYTLQMLVRKKQGSIVHAEYQSATTLDASICGVYLDLTANVTANTKEVVGFYVEIPSGAASTSRGLTIKQGTTASHQMEFVSVTDGTYFHILGPAAGQLRIGAGTPATAGAGREIAIVASDAGATSGGAGGSIYLQEGAGNGGGARGQIAIGQNANMRLGFFGGGPATQQTPTGSRGGNAALASLLTALAAYGLIVDGTSA